MSGTGERKELSPTSAAFLSTLIPFNQDTLPSEQDFLHAADELENNPPPEFTPELVSLLAAVFRNEEID